MPNYATAVIPLTNFTRKDVKFVWTPKCQESFDILKAKLTSFSCFVAKDWDKHFNVYCDSLVVAVGATLFQAHGPGNKDCPIVFASHQVTALERNYSNTYRECLTMIFSAKKFHHYLLMNPRSVFLLTIWH